MFRITKKGDYAVFILSHLARTAAEQGEHALVSAQDLASFSSLNKSLVANLLKDLTRAGFLASVRGARGGYRLAHSPREISLAQILQAVEGPFSFVECAHDDEEAKPAAHAGGDDPCCGLSPLCMSRSALLVLHTRIAQLLEDLKLADLCGLDRQNLQRLAAEMFPPRATDSGRNGRFSGAPEQEFAHDQTRTGSER